MFRKAAKANDVAKGGIRAMARGKVLSDMADTRSVWVFSSGCSKICGKNRYRNNEQMKHIRISE